MFRKVAGPFPFSPVQDVPSGSGRWSRRCWRNTRPQGTRIRLEPLAGAGEARRATVLEGMGGYRTGSEFASVSVEVYRVLLSEVVNAERG